MRRSRVGQAQMKKLLDLLSEDGVLVNGNVSYLNTNRRHFWKRMAIQLNSLEGGVYKNTWQWCKMWADWKAKTKKKANLLLRKIQNGTINPSPSLTNLERRLLSLIHYPENDKNKAEALGLEVLPKSEAPDNSDDFEVEFLNEAYTVNENKDTEEEDKTSDCFVACNGTKFCDEGGILQEDKFEGVEVLSDIDKDKSKEKGLNNKKLTLEEYKIRTTLKLEKDRVQQKSEELRLRAIELKLKGDEIRLKEMEMNKIYYLTNIEEEKLKCFREISASLKELLERTRSGHFRFQNSL